MMFHSLLLVAALTVSAAPPCEGSIVYLENSNKLVGTVTDSRLTHVGVLMRDGGQDFVYEATPAKVRRVRLKHYCQEISKLNYDRDDPMRLWIIRPSPGYTADEISRMKQFLDTQLGRRYSIQSYVRGERREGVHCAEFAADALSKTDRISLQRSHRTTPATLVAHIRPYYTDPVEVNVRSQNPQGSWCERNWRKWAGYWDWCRWSCKETWTFCW